MAGGCCQRKCCIFAVMDKAAHRHCDRPQATIRCRVERYHAPVPVILQLNALELFVRRRGATVNEVERQVIEFSLRGEHPVLEVLRQQLAVAVVSTREFSGAGFSTQFAVPAGTRQLASQRRLVIGDVYADVAGLKYGAGFLVFVERGILDMVECFTFENAWPAEASIRRLYYVRPKEPGSPSLIETAWRDLDFAVGRTAVQAAAADRSRD
jgi:hypothetical protein